MVPPRSHSHKEGRCSKPATSSSRSARRRSSTASTCRCAPGEKVGLVGRNGAGKTTLLRVLGGAAAPEGRARPAADGHRATCPRTPAPTHVPTTPPASPTCSRATGSTGSHGPAREGAPRARGGRRPRPTSTDYSQLQERFEAAGGYAAESEVRKLAAGVGLGDDRLDLPLGALSGGERRRLELVRILFAGSELLLLDEPTNHLDADARTWLLKFLRSYRGALRRGEPRPRPARRRDHARRAHRPRDRGRAPARSSSTRARTRST